MEPYYQGLNINNASVVRKLAQDGHEIVYVPCHRSHGLPTAFLRSIP